MGSVVVVDNDVAVVEGRVRAPRCCRLYFERSLLVQSALLVVDASSASYSSIWSSSCLERRDVVR